jgi:hypothetical protein
MRFVRHPHSVTLRASGQTGSATIAGGVKVGLGTTLQSVRRSTATGTLVLRLSSKKSLTLQASAAGQRAIGAPSVLDLHLAVVRSTGLTGCAKGTSVRAVVVDSDALTRSLQTKDSLKLQLPSSCGGTRSFADARSAQRLAITLAFS